MKTSEYRILLPLFMLMQTVSCIGPDLIGPENYILPEIAITDAVDLSSVETANSYIVSEAGRYCFRPVKGNSLQKVGQVSSAVVCWESFGTDELPQRGELVSGATYDNGRVYFQTADPFREGNVLIAAKDIFGNILWSWHIWLTDKPKEDIYPNDAGIMMDRNLGAVSATPGDEGSWGLLYQWGRKDPFMGLSSESDSYLARATITWPSAAHSDAVTGTLKYVVEHPTTYVSLNSGNFDWYYSESYVTDNARWQSQKTIYDPCPAGWRVPDGGDASIWKKSGITDISYDSADKGLVLGINSTSTAWYPAAGSRSADGGSPALAGMNGYYWTVTSSGNYAYALNFGYDDNVNYLYSSYRSFAFSVRCFKAS